MQIKATFLGISSEIFTDKQTGQEVKYFRLHLWDKVKEEYLKLPISADAVASAETDGTVFGDEVELEASYEPSREKNPVRIVKW